MFQTILVPLDGSAFSEQALPVACELARRFDARLVLVRVASPSSALGQNLTEEDRRAIAEQYAGVKEEEHLLSTDPQMVEHAQGQVRAIAIAEEYLANMVAGLAETRLPVEAAVPYGTVVEGILTEITLHTVDLVVIAAHAPSGLSRMLGGSVAQAVVARSPVPVLLIPPEGR